LGTPVRRELHQPNVQILVELKLGSTNVDTLFNQAQHRPIQIRVIALSARGHMVVKLPKSRNNIWRIRSQLDCERFCYLLDVIGADDVALHDQLKKRFKSLVLLI
jgi:hypothetical protein